MLNENNVGKSVFGKKKKSKVVKKENKNDEIIKEMISEAEEEAKNSEVIRENQNKNDSSNTMLDGAEDFKNDHAIKNKIKKTQTNWAYDDDIVTAIYRLKPELKKSYGVIVSDILREWINKNYPETLRKRS